MRRAIDLQVDILHRCDLMHNHLQVDSMPHVLHRCDLIHIALPFRYLSDAFQICHLPRRTRAFPSFRSHTQFPPTCIEYGITLI